VNLEFEIDLFYDLPGRFQIFGFRGLMVISIRLRQGFGGQSRYPLVVTFLALQSTDIINSYTVSFSFFDLFVVLLVNAIELVAVFAVLTAEVHFSGTVTVDTPAHA
jgi:hypothetical protein